MPSIGTLNEELKHYAQKAGLTNARAAFHAQICYVLN